MGKMRKPIGMPSRQQILDFIASSDQPAGKREIARAFGLHGADKIALKVLLKDMADEGLIDAAPGRAFHKMGGVPKVTVLRVVDSDGDSVFAVPDQWQGDGPPPRLRVVEKGRRTALGIGDRILARTEEAGRGLVAHPMKKLARGEEMMLGVVRKEGERAYLKPVDKRERRETMISDLGDARDGDLVLAEKAGRPPRITARVTQVLGDPFAPRSFSLIAIHKYGLAHVFGEDVIEEAHKVAKLDLGEREDLRHLPIVAIDPIDARDHDDAVWASPRDDGGFDAIVAIADVSFYVRTGSPLDREARKRGNSAYFPDRVVPMLPEELSADICSLKAGKDRAALACHLVIDKAGKLASWRFTRAKIRVSENLAYEEAQRRMDAGEAEPHLKDLWSAWALLAKARDNRAPLNLDLPERRVQIDDAGRITSVAVRERLDAHRLIEDFMIAANVAAAKALEAKKSPVMYRVHEVPGREKLVTLKDYLATFGVNFALGQVVTPATFNRLLELVGDAEHRQQVMEQVLRTQTQAYYAPANLGHFGLALGSYAHFTSPIRRYADLIVHRALVRSYALGPGGLTDDEAGSMPRIGEAISAAERRAMEAERETVDRYVAAYLSERVGTVLETRITGVASFGFFATVDGIGGDGLVPVSTLGDDYYRFDEGARTLIGDHSGTRYASGMTLPLRLAEADPISGSLRFELPEGGSAPRRPVGDGRRPAMGKRGRPAGIRHKGGKRK
ncbi:Ribonuclease R [Sphingomonas antarctica]|uniref:ribonuclease R n=1 Tax=Sphingomonas antarctica TaxID=2040274 RepID=UPI0039E81281